MTVLDTADHQSEELPEEGLYWCYQVFKLRYILTDRHRAVYTV